jgi:hypothetical protein
MMRSVALLVAFTNAGCICEAANAAEWHSLTAGIDAWRALDLDANFLVNVGVDDGRSFLHTPDDFSMEHEMEGASLSKWPAAMMISKVVEAGHMKFTDKANKYLDFWATDESDPRSNVTLESLLSFTSGFLEDAQGIYKCSHSDYLECAEAAYKESTKFTAPRKEFKYLSCHLQFAGAMAVASTGMHIQELFQKYLYSPFNMTMTSWSPRDYPSMAGGIRTVGKDFENYLHGMLTYNAISKDILDVAETDWTAATDPSGDGWFGHYAFGHWWECMGYGTPSERATLSEDCLAAHIQAGPGEFGFYPIIDRSGGGGQAGPERPPHYFQVILQEPDPLSGVPEYLRIVAKPISDLILGGQDPTSVTKSSILKSGGGLIRRDIEYIQSELKSCTCSRANGPLPLSADLGEPWDTMLKDLPKDEPKKNRREILASGAGITLFDIVEIQNHLGTCKCAGRS